MFFKRETSAKGVTLGVIFDVLETLCSKQFILLETQQSILEVLDRLDNGSALALDYEIQLMKLAIIVGTSLTGQEPAAPSLMMAKAFLRCCKVLPKHVKKMMRAKQEAEIHRVESLLHTLSSLVKNTHTFHEFLQENGCQTVIDNCIVACLKYGMMESGEFVSCSILGGSLKTVRLLVVKSHKCVTANQLRIGSLTPAQVHAMAISHSSFQNALSSGDKVSDGNSSEFCRGLSRRLELIRLLLCTLSLAAKQVKVDGETWTTILSVYNASINVNDRLLRRLMFLYEQSGACKHEVSELKNRTLGQLSNNSSTNFHLDLFFPCRS